MDRDAITGRLSRDDLRYLHRYEAYEIAKRQRVKWDNNSSAERLANIIELFLALGFFTVWFHIFEGQPKVLKALIEAAVGTDVACYDKDYKPIPKPIKH